MGAEHSHLQSTQRVGDGGSASWNDLAVGLQYSATDVAVWPHLAPLVLWFTEQDANALHHKLRCRTRTRFLTLGEFHAWLSNAPSDGTASNKHRPRPVEPTDKGVAPPPSLLQNILQQTVQSPLKLPQSSAVLVLDLFVEHIFTTFARGGTKLFAMEFLAAMVLGSRAIWSADQKCRVLLALFQDPANSNGSTSEPIFKHADLAHLFLCAMRGASTLTVGVQRLWKRHALDTAVLARQFATHAIQFAVAARENVINLETTTPPVKQAVSASQVQRFVDATPALRCFVALFSGEEMRNPFTFGGSRSLCDGRSLPLGYRAALDHQRLQYETLLWQYVSPEGRLARRRESAATLLQSTWRRHCSRGLLQRKRDARQRKRHASATRLQGFVRHRQLATVLERHAEAELHARNGGVLLAGLGPCVPWASASTPSPLQLVDAFKLLHVQIESVAMSRTCALALPSDRQSVFAWGRCLPCVYAEPLGAPTTTLVDDGGASPRVTLTQTTPARLAFRFPPHNRVAQLACGLSHALALTQDGNVHSWGFNDHGQLGHGAAATLLARTGGKRHYATYYDERDAREYALLAQPTPLVYFQGAAQQQAAPIPIQSVVCGDYYSMALSRDGDVFTWGEASEGQLGLGDAHASFQVAFVDRHMLNSAFTYLSEPEPVLALSDQRVVQIACKKNHSVALTSDWRVFEWGNWGKRCGVDREHALTPEQKDPLVVAPLRLRQLSVGDHHMVAEGSSVWLTLTGREDGLRVETSMYLASSPSWSCDQDAVASQYAGRQWTCVVADCDMDDIELDDDTGDTPVDEEIDQSASAGGGALWSRRVRPFRLREPTQIATYDAKFAQVAQCFPSLQTKFEYENLLALWFHGHVRKRLVAMPRGKPAGVYLQLLLPRVPFVPALEDEAALPPMVEFAVVAASGSRAKVSKPGFATHLFHPVMRERLAALPGRVRRVMPTEFLEPQSIFVVEFDECSFRDESSLLSETKIGGAADEPATRYFTRSATPDGRQVYEWQELVVQTMARRVLAAQEAGALAVLLVLDFVDAEPFELELPEDSGVYVPVLMTNKAALATRWPSSYSPTSMAVGEVLDQLVHSQAFYEPEELDQPPVVPPAWMARCFERVDTTAARIQSAVANGAAGVVLFQDEQSVEVDGETRGAPVFLDSPASEGTKPTPARLVAMISYTDSEALRGASKRSLTDSAMPFVKSDGDGEHYELLANVAVEIRAGGTVYAWGNAQNGRLGLGDPAHGPLLDGYEALTDSLYRYVDRPMPVVALAGHEMRELVCGAAHTVAVTQLGRVFTWGKGARGELAVARTKAQAEGLAQDQWVPRLLHHVQYDRIVSAAANDSATAMVTELVKPIVYLERRKEVVQLRSAARERFLP